MVTFSALGSDGMLTKHPADSRDRANSTAKWRFGRSFLRLTRKLSFLSHERMQLLPYRLLRVVILSGKPISDNERDAGGGRQHGIGKRPPLHAGVSKGRTNQPDGRESICCDHASE